MTSQYSLLEQTIVEKLSEVLNKTVEVSHEADLREEGLDSIKTIALIVNLEVAFNVQIDDEDLLVENFSSIRKIASLLSEKYGVL